MLIQIQTVEEAKNAIKKLEFQIAELDENELFSKHDLNQQIKILCEFADGGCMMFCDYEQQIHDEISRVRRGEALRFEYHPIVEALIYFFATHCR